jgi:murein DD-endopeptidase MepM/ murein hydrolase activator NlpD
MKIGTKIYASRGGVVTHLKKDGKYGGANKKYLDEANYITLRHSDGTYGKYTHLRHNGVLVSVGDKVKRGQHIGYSGNTGYSSGPHLHFIVFKGDKHNNRQSIPIKFISQNGIVTNPIKGRAYMAVK